MPGADPWRPASTRAPSPTVTPSSAHALPHHGPGPEHGVDDLGAVADDRTGHQHAAADHRAGADDRVAGSTTEPSSTRAAAATSADGSTSDADPSPAGTAGLGATPSTRSREAATRAAGVPTSRQ